MSLPNEQQIALKIQREIRQYEDDLVQWIQAALDKTETYGNLEESQFRNLVRVAETTESTEVIKNFLRYQLGRTSHEKNKEKRKWGRGKNSLAETIIRDIDDNIAKLSEKIAKTTEQSKRKGIHIELIRRYLGYGSRYLKYIKPQSTTNQSISN